MLRRQSYQPDEGFGHSPARSETVVCARTPEPFYAVGAWYEDFAQLADADIHELLGRYRSVPRIPSAP